MKVNMGFELRTGKMNDSTRARIVVGQLDGEEKHTKWEMRKWGLQIASSLDKAMAHGFIPKATYKQLSYKVLAYPTEVPDQVSAQ